MLKNYYEFTRNDLPERSRTKYDFDVKKLRRENKKVLTFKSDFPKKFYEHEFKKTVLTPFSDKDLTPFSDRQDI